MAFYRARPPANRQNLADSCWAAALDSFSRINSSVPTLRERDLIRDYGTGATGGLNSAGLERLRTALTPHGILIKLMDRLVMPYDIEDRLRQSHLILARHLGGAAWHAWLVYGIDTWIMYMEPRDGGYHTRQWSMPGFSSARGYYIFWRP